MRRTGADFEAAAADWLAARGARVVARNFTCRVGEVDLIVEEAGVLVFVEVKGRRGGADPRDAVTDFKIDRIRRAAEVYLARTNDFERDLRFDVLFVTDSPAGLAFERVEGAF